MRCTCGNEFTTRSTESELHVEICSNCHPFYTGKQKLVDTGGRVERFRRRAARRSALIRGRRGAERNFRRKLLFFRRMRHARLDTSRCSPCPRPDGGGCRPRPPPSASRWPPRKVSSAPSVQVTAPTRARPSSAARCAGSPATERMWIKLQASGAGRRRRAGRAVAAPGPGRLAQVAPSACAASRMRQRVLALGEGSAYRVAGAVPLVRRGRAADPRARSAAPRHAGRRARCPTCGCARVGGRRS